MRCIIISGSPNVDINFIKKTVKSDDYIICADKGCIYASRSDITPNLVVSDFDSCEKKIFHDCETIVLNPHKDDTDTMHSIDIAIERGYDEIVILGAIGGRFDHTFANVSALQYISLKGAKGYLLSPDEHIEYLSVGDYKFSGYNGKTFSLFPFGCSDVCVSYTGVEYPLDKYSLTSSVPMGVSNIFISDISTINIYDGNAILIINLKECV